MEKIDIISLAKNAIAVEVTELESLKNRIDEQFEKAVKYFNLLVTKCQTELDRYSLIISGFVMFVLAS